VEDRLGLSDLLVPVLVGLDIFDGDRTGDFAGIILVDRNGDVAGAELGVDGNALLDCDRVLDAGL